MLINSYSFSSNYGKTKNFPNFNIFKTQVTILAKIIAIVRDRFSDTSNYAHYQTPKSNTNFPHTVIILTREPASQNQYHSNTQNQFSKKKQYSLSNYTIFSQNNYDSNKKTQITI